MFLYSVHITQGWGPYGQKIVVLASILNIHSPWPWPLVTCNKSWNWKCM